MWRFYCDESRTCKCTKIVPSGPDLKVRRVLISLSWLATVLIVFTYTIYNRTHLICMFAESVRRRLIVQLERPQHDNDVNANRNTLGSGRMRRGDGRRIRFVDANAHGPVYFQSSLLSHFSASVAAHISTYHSAIPITHNHSAYIIRRSPAVRPNDRRIK